MTLRLLRAADRPPTPWKNDGGVTREIAVHPPGANLAAFDWRVSIATVSVGGPFSNFPGVDRSLSVLAGELHLRIDGRRGLTLTPLTPPALFAGEAAVSARTPAAPVTDLNVMTRRGVVEARLERFRGPGDRVLQATDWTVIYCRSPSVRLGHRANVIDLHADDAALIDGANGEPTNLHGDEPANVFIIHFARVLGR